MRFRNRVAPGSDSLPNLAPRIIPDANVSKLVPFDLDLETVGRPDSFQCAGIAMFFGFDVIVTFELIVAAMIKYDDVVVRVGLGDAPM